MTEAGPGVISSRVGVEYWMLSQGVIREISFDPHIRVWVRFS